MTKKLQIKVFYHLAKQVLGDLSMSLKMVALRRSTYSAMVIIIASISLAACNGSRGLAKKANQLQEAGFYTDAAEYYYNSLLKNRNNVDARIGLAANAQRVLNDKLSEFSRAKSIDDHKQAVYTYLGAMAYREKVERFGIKLTTPEYLTTDFNDVKSIYVKGLYNQGNDLMAEKKFDEANRVLSELSQLEPNYKDVADLKNVSQNEPVYILATEFFDNHEFRKAYYKFNEIYMGDRNYKDVSILRNECLDKGQYPVAVVPFENASRSRGIEKSAQAYVLTDLAAINDPFLKIIERENMETILSEQRLSLSGMVNEETAARVGNLLGAKAIITGTVLSYTTKPGRMRVNEKKAFESYQVKLYNKELDKNYFETRYKSVTYKEYYNNNEINISFQYKAISLETGEVLFSRVINKNLESDVYFGVYPGEITNLFPAGKDGVLTGSRERKELLGIMRASRDIKSVEELSADAYSIFAKALTSDMVNLINKQ